MHWAVLLLSVVGARVALRPDWEPGTYPSTEAGAVQFVNAYNSTAEEVFSYSTEASWAYKTNLTGENSQQE
ncbi:angiotensin-converting enzyme, partial [Clarias magur]